MNTYNTQKAAINLSKSSRAARLVIGVALIVGVMTTSLAPLGLLAVLPLLAIYPVFTGMTGWDPLREFCKSERITDCLLHLPTPARMVIGAIGIAMLGSVFVVSGAPGWLIVLPLLAVYPVFIAVIGEEPITALYNIDSSEYRPSTTSTTVMAEEPIQTKQVEISSQVEDHHPLAA